MQREWGGVRRGMKVGNAEDFGLFLETLTFVGIGRN